MNFVFRHLGLRGVCTSTRSSHFQGHIHARPDLRFEGRTLPEATAAFQEVVERYKGTATERPPRPVS